MVRRLLIGCGVSLAVLTALSLQVAEADEPGKCKSLAKEVAKCDSVCCAAEGPCTGQSLAAIAHEFALAPVFKACTAACGFAAKCDTADKCDTKCCPLPGAAQVVSACECVVAPAKTCNGTECSDSTRSCAAGKCEEAVKVVPSPSFLPRIIVRAIRTCSGCECGSSCSCDADSKCGQACQCDGLQAAKVVVHAAATRCPAKHCPVLGKFIRSRTGTTTGEWDVRQCPVMAETAAPCGEAQAAPPHIAKPWAPVPVPLAMLPPPPHMHFAPMHAPHPALMDKLMALTAENARLTVEAKAREELAKQREMFVEELVRSRVENARLTAHLEMVGQRDELVEQLVETMVEKARLEGHAHSVEERAAMAVELAHKETAPTATHSAIAEMMRELAKFREENQRLRQQVTELQERLESQAARTAERAVAPDLEAELTAPR